MVANSFTPLFLAIVIRKQKLKICSCTKGGESSLRSFQLFGRDYLINQLVNQSPWILFLNNYFYNWFSKNANHSLLSQTQIFCFSATGGHTRHDLSPGETCERSCPLLGWGVAPISLQLININIRSLKIETFSCTHQSADWERHYEKYRLFYNSPTNAKQRFLQCQQMYISENGFYYSLSFTNMQLLICHEKN